jgi:hypothetical protein
MEESKMKYKIIVIVLTIFAFQDAKAQDPLFERRTHDFKTTAWGPNRAHFISPFISSSLGSLDEENFDPNKFSLASSIQLGIRYKYKLLSFMNLGLETGFSPEIWFNSGERFTEPADTLTLVSSSVRMVDLFENAFVRIRFGQRGNYLGNYIDIGGGLVHPVTSSSIKTYTLRSESRSSIVVKHDRIDNPFQLGITGFLRVGFDRIALFFSYTELGGTGMYKLGIDLTPIRY